MHPLPIGTVVAGDYEVTRPLKEGGMGAVYVARQRSTGRARALKILPASVVATPRGRERFEREAKIGAEIASEHVVEVLGAGVDDALGVPWIAMELVEGTELGAFAERAGRLSLSDVAEIARQLAHPLGLAHARGIVHRDLKPENILVGDSRTAGARFTIKLVDFGIARVREDSPTEASVSMGTPAWMAPEQADVGAEVDVRADVWSLGLVFFRLLAGRSYWRAAQPHVGSFLRVMSEVCFEPLDAASRRSDELGGAPLPRPAEGASFDDWFARCVVRDPGQRYATADAALRDLVGILERAGDGRAEIARGPTAPVSLELRSSLYPVSSRLTGGPADAALPGVRREQSFHLRGFVGRSALLGELDAWIDGDAQTACLVLTGGPGSGKSALAAVVAERRGALLHMVKSHKSPLRFLRALALQAELVAGGARPGPAPSDVEDARAELYASLERAVAVKRPLVVVVDGLDELDDPEDVGALPPHWPDGVRVLLTARPDRELLLAVRMRLSSVEERRLPPLDADDVEAFVRSIDPSATRQRIDEVRARASGLPLLVRRAIEGPSAPGATLSLDDVFADAYRAVARDPGRARTLHLLVVAREALDAVSLAELASVEDGRAGRALLERVRADLTAMSEYLLEVRSGAFVPWHAGLSEFVRDAVLGEEGVRAVERVFAAWTEPRAEAFSRYALKHRVRHLRAAGLDAVAARELASPAFVAASVGSGRVFDLVAELDRARSPYAAAIRRHAHFLARHPGALPSILPSIDAAAPWLERVDVPAGTPAAEVFRLVGHRDEVWGVAASRDGARVATASADGTLRLWEPQTGRELGRVELGARPSGKPRRAFAVAFAEDGERLYASVDDEGLVVVEVASMLGPDASAPRAAWWSGQTSWCVAVSHDGARVAAGSRRGEVRVWSRAGAHLFDLPVGGVVTALAFDDDGRLAVGTEWRRLAVASAAGEELFRDADLPGAPMGLGFVDGVVVAACADGAVRAWDRSGARASERSFPGDRLYAAAFARGRIAVGGQGGVVHVGDAAEVSAPSDAEPRRIPAHRATVDALAFLPGSDGAPDLLLTGSADGTARGLRADADPGATREERVTAFAFTPDGEAVVSGLHDGAVRVHRIGAPAPVRVAARRARIQSISFSADGALVALASQDGTTVVARTARLLSGSTDVVAELRAHGAAVNAAAFVPPAGLVATGSSDETVALSTLFGGRVIRRWTRGASVVAVGASPSGGRLAAWSRDGELAVFDTKGEATWVAALDTDLAVVAVAFLDEDTLVVAPKRGPARAFSIGRDALVPAEVDAGPSPLVCVADRVRAETRLEREGEAIAAYPFALEPCLVAADARHVAGWSDGELHVLAVRGLSAD